MSSLGTQGNRRGETLPISVSPFTRLSLSSPSTSIFRGRFPLAPSAYEELNACLLRLHPPMAERWGEQTADVCCFHRCYPPFRAVVPGFRVRFRRNPPRRRNRRATSLSEESSLSSESAAAAAAPSPPRCR